MTNLYFLYLGILVILALVIGVPLYYRVSGDLAVCRSYYKEMSLMQCYFSSKTVRVPEGK